MEIHQQMKPERKRPESPTARAESCTSCCLIPYLPLLESPALKHSPFRHLPPSSCTFTSPNYCLIQLKSSKLNSWDQLYSRLCNKNIILSVKMDLAVQCDRRSIAMSFSNYFDLINIVIMNSSKYVQIWCTKITSRMSRKQMVSKGNVLTEVSLGRALSRFREIVKDGEDGYDGGSSVIKSNAMWDHGQLGTGQSNPIAVL